VFRPAASWLRSDPVQVVTIDVLVRVGEGFFRMKSLMRYLLAISMGLCVTASAHAQYMSMYGNQSSLAMASLANMQYLMTNSSMNYTLSRLAQTKKQMAAGNANSAAGPAVSHPALNAVPPDFTFPYQGRLLSLDEIAGFLTDSPEQKREVVSQLGTLIQTVAEDLAKDGPAYDVSKAFAFFTTVMYSVLHPESPIDERASARLLRQFRLELLNPTSLKTVTAAKLQEQWETLLALGGWALMSYETASQQNNTQLGNSVRRAAEMSLKALFQVDPSNLRFDPNSEWPLSLAEGSAPAAAPAASHDESKSAVADSAPVKEVATGPVEAAKPSRPGISGNLIRVGHHHTLTGMHPAELRLDPDGLAFDPLGQPCSQSQVKVAYADVQVGEPAANYNGELLLNVRMRNPKNPKKWLNFNFVTADSTIDESTGAPIVKSPAGAADQLREIASVLRSHGAK